MKKTGILLVIALAALLASSCASTAFSGLATCTGRVCGPHGEPVEHYQIAIDGKHVLTGANGIFIIPALKAGTYRVKGAGRGWASVETQLVFDDRRGIFCIQVEPMHAVYQSVESQLNAGLYDEAESLLHAHAEENAGTPLFDFYCALIAYCRQPTEAGRQSLREKMEKEVAYAL